MSDFFVYCGLAGDTDPGRFWSAGLYRSRNAEGAWESIGERLGAEPHVFSILADSRRGGRVTVGTQDGIWRSDDAGDNWRRLDAPKPALGVWSLAFHPAEPDTLFAGYEPFGIQRSMDGGDTWATLQVDVRFPAVSDRPEIPKRVISIAIDPGNPLEIYASLEVGGLLRSLDGGANWENVIDGLYLDEGFVDIHAVVVNPKISGQLTIATRYGVFRSDDRGAHWRDLKVPQLRPIGSYCRSPSLRAQRPKHTLSRRGERFRWRSRRPVHNQRQRTVVGENGAWRLAEDADLRLGHRSQTARRSVLFEQDRPARLFARPRRHLERESFESGRRSCFLAGGWARLGLTVLVTKQNFHQAIRVADRGDVVVRGSVAFGGQITRGTWRE